MFVVSILSQKGGTGKTTMLIGLAVAAARADHHVALIDLDPQASVMNWKGRRAPDHPAAVATRAERLVNTLKAARDAGVDYVFIDTPGRLDDATRATAELSDLVLVPTRPNIVEVETLPRVRAMIEAAGDPPSFVVLNGIHPASGRAVEELQEAIGRLFGLPVAPVHLCQRNAHGEAMATGQTPQEQDPTGKAAQELERLFGFVAAQRQGTPAEGAARMGVASPLPPGANA